MSCSALAPLLREPDPQLSTAFLVNRIGPGHNPLAGSWAAVTRSFVRPRRAVVVHFVMHG